MASNMAACKVNSAKLVSLNLRASNTCVRLLMNEEQPPTKAVASALGGILGNLKSGKGLFGAEATKTFSKTVLTTVEQQIAEVGQEMRSADSADSIKKSDAAAPAAGGAMSKPAYTADDRWDVTVACASLGVPLEVTVRPTQPAALLLKAWAKENGANANEWDLVVPRGTSWTYGIVDPAALIGDTGIIDGGKAVIIPREV